MSKEVHFERYKVRKGKSDNCLFKDALDTTAQIEIRKTILKANIKALAQEQGQCAPYSSHRNGPILKSRSSNRGHYHPLNITYLNAIKEIIEHDITSPLRPNRKYVKVLYSLANASATHIS